MTIYIFGEYKKDKFTPYPHAIRAFSADSLDNRKNQLFFDTETWELVRCQRNVGHFVLDSADSKEVERQLLEANLIDVDYRVRCARKWFDLYA